MDKNEALLELYRRDKLNPTRKAAVEELIRRKVLVLPGAAEEETAKPEPTPEQLTLRQQATDDAIADIWGPAAFAISIGKGVENVGRGMGLLPEPSEQSQEGMAKLEAKHPIATTAGEIVGEATPFMLPGGAIGKLASLPVRAVASGVLGATEGGILANSEGGDVEKGAGLGGAIGVSAEMLFPVIGRIGRKIVQRVRGKAPSGSILDATGKPTAEFQEVLQETGLNFDDLTDDAIEVIKAQKPGADQQQAATAALAAETGVPLSKGNLTQDYGQQALENRLLESATDKSAEPFRQFKLRQSQAIEKGLRNNFDYELMPEETGTLIQDALSGRNSLLRTEKNRLYGEASEAAREAGGIPLFTDGVSSAIPDADLMEDLAITSPAAIESLDKILVKYGLKEPTEEAIEKGFTPTQLSVENFERFRKTLNMIERGDASGASSVAIGPIKEALDTELVEMTSSMTGQKGQEAVAKVKDSLLEARKTVTQLKKEFNPQSITGRLIQAKKDGNSMFIEASKAYDKLVGRASPVEDTRKVITSLLRSDGGEEAVSAMQTSTLMDLINSGFSTKSRTVDGVNIFNPIAFRNRVEAIGENKLKEIFKNNMQSYRNIKNIDKVAKTLTPPSGAVPKGSSNAIFDIANKLGLISLTAKIPGGPAIAEMLSSPVRSAQTRIAANKAQKAIPEVTKTQSMLEQTFPGIFAASVIATANDKEEKTNE